MTKQAANPVLIQLHDDGAHLIHEGNDHGVVSPDCLALTMSHRRSVREMITAMRAADHEGDTTPDEQQRLDETDEAEMLDALRLARYRFTTPSHVDKLLIELHANEMARDAELLERTFSLPISLTLSLSEAVMADPSRAMAGLGGRSVSDFATIEAKITAFQALDQACEASWAAQDKAESEESAKQAEAETDRCFKRLGEAANAIRDHQCATSAEATALLVFAAGSPAFQREIFEQGDESQIFLKSLCNFAAPAPEAEHTEDDTTEDAGNVWDLINAHKAALARKCEVAARTNGMSPETADEYHAASRLEEIAAVELIAALWDRGEYANTQINDYLRSAEAAGEQGAAEPLGEMSRELVMALRDHYRANPTASAE